MLKGLAIFFVLILLHGRIYSQIDVEICNKQKIRIHYFNQTDSVISYFNPFIFLRYDKKSKKSYIGNDRLKVSGDTMFVFLNDTSFNEIGYNGNHIDDLDKKDGRWTTKNLPPNGKINVNAYLKRKHKVKIVVVYTTIEGRLLIKVKHR